jgi:hypothetical protein
VALQSRGDRELTDWERDRIRELYDQGVADPEFGLTIDNSDQTVGETVDAIQALLDDPSVEPVSPSSE